MSWRRLRWSATLFLWPVLACKESAGPANQPCSSANSRLITLAVSEYISIDPDSTAGCVAFPANAAGTEAEYVLVPQVASGVPGHKLNFVLRGETELLAAPAASGRASVVSRQAGAAPIGPAERFHDFLRRTEATRTWGSGSPDDQPAAAPGEALLVPKPKVGDVRNFRVCANLFCTAFDPVDATARAVGDRIAIFVDVTAPPGLNDDDLDTLITTFDDRLHPIATAAFGSESDINQDTVVIVLMTNTVNSLVSAAECMSEGFVSGFFLGADIDPTAPSTISNRGEIFYSIVADPDGSLSCEHSTAQIKDLVPVTFMHEFQHMISFHHHVRVHGANEGEVLWLNEALSHYAEELGGRSYLADGDVENYFDFVSGDILNAYRFLQDPGGVYLLPDGGIGRLQERGAGWLYVRHLVDHYADNTTPETRDVFTRALVSTPRSGASNIEFVTGTSFQETVGRWALANWVDDLVVPGFTPPPELSYPSWDFRRLYDSLYTARPQTFPVPYPLMPSESDPAAIDLSGTLYGGSGLYHRVLQAAGDPGFVLTFRAPDGWILAPSHAPRLNIVRIR